MKRTNNNRLYQHRLVGAMARNAGVSFDLAIACVGEYQGLGRDMEDILRFVAERSGKASVAQANMLSSGDWKVQRKGIMEVLGKELWRRVQHSCGSNPQRVDTIAHFLLTED